MIEEFHVKNTLLIDSSLVDFNNSRIIYGINWSFKGINSILHKNKESYLVNLIYKNFKYNLNFLYKIILLILDKS